MIPDIEEQLLLLFRLTKRRLQAIAERHALTFPQLIALRHLHRAGALTMSDLTKRLGTTRGALTGLVDRLEEAGFVTRQPAQDDRRVVRLELTPQALRILAALQDDWSQEVQSWLAGLAPPTRESLSIGLTALIDAESALDP